MILRRVIEHVKGQNWLAVMIDFIIVVTGVYIGIEVSNWNASRLAATEEKRLIAQLVTEVDAATEVKAAWIEQTEPRLTLLRSALAVIQSEVADARLSAGQCEAVALSHIVVFGTSSLPTLDEILSTGGLGLISDARARRAMMQYRSSLAEVRSAFDFIRADFANLIDTYGHAFPRLHTPDGLKGAGPIATSIHCNTAAVINDPTLRNRIVSNLARTQQLKNLVEHELQLLAEIKYSLQPVLR